jgi:hypothetical protein
MDLGGLGSNGIREAGLPPERRGARSGAERCCIFDTFSPVRVRDGSRSSDETGVEVDHRVLIFDGPDGELQQLALDLIGREFEVHYANDPDEAQMLARETGGRINAVVFAPHSPDAVVPDLARRFGVSPAALIPTGPRPDAATVEALLQQGVRWHLWDEPTDESIRFVISSVLFEQDPLEIRYHTRVPTRVEAFVELGERKAGVSIRDISLGGACLVGPVLGAQNAEGTLHFAHRREEFSLPFRIAWCVDVDDDALGVCGVSFLETTPGAVHAINTLVEAVIARHKITRTD